MWEVIQEQTVFANNFYFNGIDTNLCTNNQPIHIEGIIMFDEVIGFLKSFGAFAMRAISDGYTVLATPQNFYMVKIKNEERAFKNSIKFMAYIALILAALNYYDVSSVSKIADKNIYILGSTFISFLEGLVFAAIFFTFGKMTGLQGSLKITTAVVLYACAILPFISFLMTPLSVTRMEAMVSDTSVFSYGYESSFYTLMQGRPLASLCNFFGLLGFCLFGRIIYIGLRIANRSGKFRTALVVFLSLVIMNLAQVEIMLPIEQMFLKANLDGWPLS
jgi:hypothetical protein